VIERPFGVGFSIRARRDVDLRNHGGILRLFVASGKAKGRHEHPDEAIAAATARVKSFPESAHGDEMVLPTGELSAIDSSVGGVHGGFAAF